MSAPASRPTPWDVVFGDDVFETELFPAIEHEAQERGIDPRTLDSFLLLSNAAALLKGLSPDAAEMAGGPGDLPPLDAVRRYGPLVFHAFHFWHHGRLVVGLDEASTRRIVASRQAIGEWRLASPAPAGYLQLPRNLLWSRVDEDAQAEPADGFFWTIVEPDGSGPLTTALLLVLGLRADRPGFSVVDAMSPLPEPLGHWGDFDARVDGEDFANILPGGELSNLYGLVNVAELFKLASRAFHSLARREEADRP